MKSFDETRQIALPLISEAPRPRYLDDALIASITSDADAIRLCIEYRVRRFTKGEIAGALGLRSAHLSKVLAGTHNLNGTQCRILQYLCSNFAIKQYNDRIEEEINAATETPIETIERLKRELEQARKAA